MIDPSSPEFVAARVVAVVALERLIRSRSAFFVWGAAALALFFVIGAVVSDGLGAVVLGLFALGSLALAATLFTVRGVVLRGVRRVGGGRDYARLKPLVEKRMDAVEHARTVIPLDPPSVLRLAWMARRPRDLQEHLRKTAETVVRTIPEVVADVRHELAQPVVHESVRKRL